MLCPESVLVTGANRGIGLEFVKQFLALPKPPKHVFAGSRKPDQAQDLKEIADKNKSVVVLQIDLNEQSSIQKAAAAAKEVVGDMGLNLLINNAGAGSADGVEDVTSEAMQTAFATNATGPLLVVQAFLPLLKIAAAGQQSSPLSINKAAIINISTGVASITENDTGGGYSYRASKAALNMITKTLSLDLKKFGILATALHPGFVDTDMTSCVNSDKKISTADCVLSLFSVMSKCHGDEYTGKFYHYSGRKMAW